MARKVRSAVGAKSNPSFLVVARTDAAGVEGMDAAIERAKRYVDAGADAVFPEGLRSEAEFAAFRAALGVPLLANMTEFGVTPLLPVRRFSELGYEMVIFPVTALRVAAKAVGDWYAHLAREGTQDGYLERMVTRKELYGIVGYSEYEETDAAWAALE
jgi:methylisocitrate lyase